MLVALCRSETHAWPHALDVNGHRCEVRANNAVCWDALDRAAADASHRIFVEARRQVNRTSVCVADSWTGTTRVPDYKAAHSTADVIFDEAVRAMPRSASRMNRRHQSGGVPFS